MGRVSGPFGVKGWLKVQPFGEASSLSAYGVWWIETESGWVRHALEKVQVQGEAVVAKLVGCDDRDGALHFRGRQIAVPRSEFPEAGENEFYWADLVGLRVINAAGEDLGVVAQVVETGANDVLVVHGGRERLIPFLEHVVQRVDVAGGTIRVDWGSDF